MSRLNQRILYICLGGLCIAACDTTGTNTVAPQMNTPSDPNIIADNIRKACGFLPTLTSILSIINAPGAPQANKVVELVCAGAKKERAELEAAQPQQPGEEAEEAGPTVIRPGTQLRFEVLGRPVSGVTT